MIADTPGSKEKNIAPTVQFYFFFCPPFAGASIGRWFGVPYDDELEGMYRAGTLPHNQRVMSYSVIPQEEEELELGPGRERGRVPEPEQPQQGQDLGRRRLQRMRNTLTATLRRRKKETKEEVLKSLPTFWPVVTVLVTLIEVGLLIAVIITNGLAPIAFTPQQEFEVVRGFDNQTATVTREIVPNFFIGPTKQALIHSGALYAPVSLLRKFYNYACYIAKCQVAVVSIFCSVCVRTLNFRSRQQGTA